MTAVLDAPLLLWLAVLIVLALLPFALESSIGGLRMKRLCDLPATEGPWPRVSIVVAGRNEELAVEEALRSLLGLDYPDLEVVFIDDRSTDGTRGIAERIARADARLRVVAIDAVPAGWLGKNWALHHGAKQASGELVLFTDADVVFEPTVLRRAVPYLVEQDLQLLTSAPNIIIRGRFVGVFVVAFGFFFSIFSRPWRATDSSPEHHVGVGAFNLVRRPFYLELGGHEPIRMRPDDDMKLAKHLKKNGGREELVFGREMIRVEWYRSTVEAARGLEKNAFSGVEYSLPRLIAASIGVVVMFLWPFVAIFVTEGATRMAYLALVVLLIGLVTGMAIRSGAGRPWLSIFFPIGVLAFLIILWRASILTLARGGIDWRGTFYSLDELRANRV